MVMGGQGVVGDARETKDHKGMMDLVPLIANPYSY